MAISDFQNFGFLTHQKTKFRLKKMQKKIIDIQRKGIHVIELCVTNNSTKFQANIFIFWL